MSAPTKERALKKLDAVMMKVGYPDKWRDYSTYDVDRTSFLGNAVRGNAWRSDYYIKKLDKPVDRTEWDMTPQTYNAYYNPSNNEIVLPAAAFILPGIADSLVDDAIVYAYAGGSTIGHEITHGFDDEGRQFDEKGNLKDWWTPDDAKEFKRARGEDRRAVQRLHRRRLAARERQCHAGREHRRPRRRAARLGRVHQDRRVQGGQVDRRAHAGAAVTSSAGRSAG